MKKSNVKGKKVKSKHIKYHKFCVCNTKKQIHIAIHGVKCKAMH